MKLTDIHSFFVHRFRLDSQEIMDEAGVKTSTLGTPFSVALNGLNLSKSSIKKKSQVLQKELPWRKMGIWVTFPRGLTDHRKSVHVYPHRSCTFPKSLSLPKVMKKNNNWMSSIHHYWSKLFHPCFWSNWFVSHQALPNSENPRELRRLRYHARVCCWWWPKDPAIKSDSSCWCLIFELLLCNLEIPENVAKTFLCASESPPQPLEGLARETHKLGLK